MRLQNVWFKSDQNGIESSSLPRHCTDMLWMVQIRPKWDWKHPLHDLIENRSISVQIRPKWDWKYNRSKTCVGYHICSNQTKMGLKDLRGIFRVYKICTVQIRPKWDWKSFWESSLSHSTSCSNQTKMGLKVVCRFRGSSKTAFTSSNQTKMGLKAFYHFRRQ